MDPVVGFNKNDLGKQGEGYNDEYWEMNLEKQ